MERAQVGAMSVAQLLKVLIGVRDVAAAKQLYVRFEGALRAAERTLWHTFPKRT